MTKRALDIVVTVAALLVVGPLLPLMAILVILDSGRPAFYRGWRAGRNGVPFRILKLRTMVQDAEKRGGAETAADDPRITRVGSFLRHYKLDEVPQLINIMLGDMSLVGPRPEVLDEVERYGDREKALLSVRPGITAGLPSNSGMKEKFCEGPRTRNVFITRRSNRRKSGSA